MKNTPLVYLTLFLLSASMLCFEIVSTRIASVIFVQNYAFIILSLALLGLGSGGVFSYYRFKSKEDPSRILLQSFFVLGVSLCLFIIAVIELALTNAIIFFVLLFLPFLIGGIVYAQIYKAYSSLSFPLYAFDLSGAAVGSVASLGLIGILGAPNSILLLALVMFCLSTVMMRTGTITGKRAYAYSILFVLSGALFYNGKYEFLGRVPIGDFPEKDFYHVYPDPSIRSQIIDSRWSIYGRSDLVEYSHQDMVRQLFIDGAAGTQVYRFNGNVRKTNSILQELLLHHTNAIPFLCLDKGQKRSMLVIGPGGGKEVLIGLFGEVEKITGVEVNPDFVQIVKDYKAFDGGIYTDFPNVEIVVEEGRHYVKQTKENFDLIVMALPSTAQTQNIEPFAESENYLLTREAIQDYLRLLAPDGRMIFTVHNSWELTRLIVTALSVFREMGVPGDEMRNHFAVFEAEYAPTVVIKKSAFTLDETRHWQEVCKNLPKDFPPVTFLPYGMITGNRSATAYLLTTAGQSYGTLQAYVDQNKFDISPCMDDKPYFYNMDKGVPGEYLWLLAVTAGANVLVIWLPFRLLKKGAKQNNAQSLTLPLVIFACIGAGFMVVEVSLFQKLILYLGSPTISLGILLSSLLVGMGMGSYCGKMIFPEKIRKRLYVVSSAIVVLGILLFVSSPLLLSVSLISGLPFRSAACFLAVLPLAFLLGIPFPSCIQMLTLNKQERYIPWLYGVNGFMSVLGSVSAVILSMLVGFTPTYFAGLLFYLCIPFLLFFSRKSIIWSSVSSGPRLSSTDIA